MRFLRSGSLKSIAACSKTGGSEGIYLCIWEKTPSKEGKRKGLSKLCLAGWNFRAFDEYIKALFK